MADTMVTVSELEKRFDELLERVENGERILIARAGVPFLQMTPFLYEPISAAKRRIE